MTAREHSIGNIVPLRRGRPAHPSMLPAVERTLLYDQDRDVDAPGYDVTWTVPGHVVLSTLEADLIASMLDRARPHVPSRQAVDDAIALLTGKGEA